MSSLWMATTEPTTATYPSLDGSLEVDVAVVGAGVAGLLTAVLLRESALHVAVLEAGRVGAGVTGHSTAKVTSQHGLRYARLARERGEQAARTYAEANQAGLVEYERLVERYGIDCAFTRGPAYVYATGHQQALEIELEAEAAQLAGLPAHLTTDTELPFPVRAAVRFDDQAHLHPRRFCLELASALAEGGASVFESSRVTDVADGEPCVVRTERGEVRARHVVIATGLPILDRGGHFATTHPQRSYALAARIDGTIPEGMYISADQPVRSLRPALGEYLIVGGEGHKVGQDRDESRHYANLEAWAREHFGVREVAYRWSAQDYQPVDGVPYIGRLGQRSERILVATGFQKWGFTTAGLAGRLLTDVVRGQDNPWAELFDASRMPRSGYTSLVTENANVAKRFLIDRLAAFRSPGAGQLQPGQAAVLRAGGRPVAAYRDEGGELHTVSATCTHLGCTVAFNEAERTWDCPCHGSRYDVDGEVLHGPAVRALAPVDEEVVGAASGGVNEVVEMAGRQLSAAAGALTALARGARTRLRGNDRR
jgi:glycine/D-amino acid oxidase-like deaminating enzyme/nitrite reductase/ring-hydroxylating ferredoxin subunit